LTQAFTDITDLNFDEVKNLITSILSFRLLQLEARDTSQKLMLWKSTKQMNCKNIDLRQETSAIQLGVNTSVVFFYEFASSSKLFYLMRYWYLLQYYWLFRILSTFHFSSLSIMTVFEEELEHFLEIGLLRTTVSLTNRNTKYNFHNAERSLR